MSSALHRLGNGKHFESREKWRKLPDGNPLCNVPHLKRSWTRNLFRGEKKSQFMSYLNSSSKDWRNHILLLQILNSWLCPILSQASWLKLGNPNHFFVNSISHLSYFFLNLYLWLESAWDRAGGQEAHPFSSPPTGQKERMLHSHIIGG